MMRYFGFLCTSRLSSNRLFVWSKMAVWWPFWIFPSMFYRELKSLMLPYPLTNFFRTCYVNTMGRCPQQIMHPSMWSLTIPRPPIFRRRRHFDVGMAPNSERTYLFRTSLFWRTVLLHMTILRRTPEPVQHIRCESLTKPDYSSVGFLMYKIMNWKTYDFISVHLGSSQWIAIPLGDGLVQVPSEVHVSQVNLQVVHYLTWIHSSSTD